MRGRDVMAFGVLAVSILAAIWLIDRPGPATLGEHGLQVVGPSGVLFDGVVEARNTPFDVLLAGADGRFDVRATGRGADVFVVSIAGHANQGSGGWCYAVFEGGDWAFPQVGAGAYRLAEGAAVRWSYEPQGCP